MPRFVAEFNAKAGKRVRPFRKRPGSGWKHTTGQATCANCATSSSAACCWPRGDFSRALAAIAGRPRRAKQRWLSLPLDGSISLDDMEKTIIETALARAEGNVTAAARLLKSTRETLRYRVVKFGLNKTDSQR